MERINRNFSTKAASLTAMTFTAIAAALIIALALAASFGSAASGPSFTTVVQQPEKPQPRQSDVTPEEAAEYKCSTLETMNERIRCRLGLSAENEYDYLPEECRAQTDAARNICVANYKKVRQCWVFSTDNERFNCAKSTFSLAGTEAGQKAQCEALMDSEKAICMQQLKGKVDLMAKFRIYNLEEKAQQLMGKGVNSELVADFVVLMEQKKQEYNAANTITGKKRIIKEIQRLWQSFTTKAKRQAR
ncbi:hypothetical protein HYU17_02910 [Candidatus Woesearchaeota archaeon]|nr:hypothetical protein [Candidatus Woesearchaeota archaeon]